MLDGWCDQGSILVWDQGKGCALGRGIKESSERGEKGSRKMVCAGRRD